MVKFGKADQRKHRRVPVIVAGRYMLPDRQEFPCTTVDISAGGLLVQCEVPPYRGQRVVVYLNELGRVEGTATRVSKDSFALAITSTSLKRERIAANLTWLANSEDAEVQESRASVRIQPNVGRASLVLSTGKIVPVIVREFSLSGATIKTDLALQADARVTLGTRPAQVVRATESGYALHFLTPLSERELTPNTIF